MLAYSVTGLQVECESLLPRARMREAGLSNRFCPSVRPSVCPASVCQPCKIEISQCTVAKPDKKMGIRKKEAFVYLIATKPLEFVAYGSSFVLNIGHFYGLQLRNSNTDVNTDVHGFWHVFILKIELKNVHNGS